MKNRDPQSYREMQFYIQSRLHCRQTIFHTHISDKIGYHFRDLVPGVFQYYLLVFGIRCYRTETAEKAWHRRNPIIIYRCRSGCISPQHAAAAETMYVDFATIAMDQLVHVGAYNRYMTSPYSRMKRCITAHIFRIDISPRAISSSPISLWPLSAA